MSDLSVQKHQSTNHKLTMSDSAIAHVEKYLQKHGEAKGIHFGVKKSGCSGYAYVIDYVNEINPEAIAIEINNRITVYIDKSSYPFVKGTQIDYVKKGLNEQFIFHNPNQSASCGCGESFVLDSGDEE